MTILVRGLVVLVLVASGVTGCASSARRPQPAASAAASAPPASSAAAFRGEVDDDAARLTALWRRRSQEQGASDYPIGPGDVLEISVPAMAEIKERTARVSGDGTIALPFVGTVAVKGRTENEVRDELRRHLEAYMYDPQVTVFVREYRSRQVAVVGAVERPGLYSPASKGDTIFDMIALAGGIKEEGTSRILFVPAELVEREKAREVAADLPPKTWSADQPPLLLKRSDPIIVDLKDITAGADRTALSVPVRPGDVVMVPGNGEVLVQGWVEKPGSYKITRELTVLGAVAAAGGPSFAANPGSVRVIRTGKQSERVFFDADLEKIKVGEMRDVSLQDGDVIEVGSSAPKLVAYGAYRFFDSVFRVGAGVSLPLF